MAKFFSQEDFNSVKNRKKRSINQELRIGPISVRFVTIILITVLSIIYLAQSNLTATKGYQLKELQEREEELNLENERLEVEASRLKALKNIEKVAREKNMVAIDKVKYPEQ